MVVTQKTTPKIYLGHMWEVIGKCIPSYAVTQKLFVRTNIYGETFHICKKTI